ncbi:hypothetical protein CR162_08750 [Pseudoroseomonas rhizosphaerae]|uniref:Uncharacterized protein n=1 Tax=Teichococcus rhizosphaerae TaxID=1335062 RepID=A0A2C6Y371_9PROT|nr:hypothetical protein [Pseudoroseomonas rhizosphaerae]PHK95252.1 hypothetical protein CR162_08750 [Pseudoroseomonas rhizosphaerae]
MSRLDSLLHRRLPGLLVAGTLLIGAGAALAQTAFEPMDRAANHQLRFTAAEQGRPIHAGGEVAVAGQGFRPGQKVTLLYGATPLPGGTLVADAEGKVSGRMTIPAEAEAGTYPIVVVAQGPYNATIASLKVSPRIPLSGQEGFELKEAQVARGLYQSAYSARNKALFVTSAVGRPPVRQSELLRLDPETLAVVARVTPQAAPGRGAAADGGVYAVYGIGVDDANDTVWVTNSRQNTVAVYRQSDLALVRQFEPGTVNHVRDVAIDPQAGKAFVSATFRPEVVVFGTGKPEVSNRIEIPSGVRGGTFSAASLSLDAKAHRLYVVSNTTNEVAVIDTRTDKVEKVLPVPGARGSIGVSHDPRSGRIFLGPAPLANHVSAGPDGTVYAVDKSANARQEEGDTLLRIRPRS